MLSRTLVVVLSLVLSGLTPQVLLAKSKTAWVAGKVYDTDKTTPLAGIPIRIVNVETGNVLNEKTQEEGCYRFKSVAKGSYSLAVTYKGQEYLLPEKVMVELDQREIAVAVCVAISDKDNSLILLDNCHVCLGGGFPPVGVFLITGTAAVVSGIAIGHDKPPVVSESRP